MKVYVSFPGALNNLGGDFIIKNEIYWNELLINILNASYGHLFDGDLPRNYIVLYLNEVKIDTLNKVKLSDQDSLNILSAISGG